MQDNFNSHMDQSNKMFKKRKKSAPQDLKGKNPKAFAFNSVNKAAKKIRRTMDLQEKRKHVPIKQNSVSLEPPLLVVVVGPPNVGKSTLIKSLLVHYTDEKITKVRGPVVVVTGKKQRIQLMECNNDINTALDLIKIADLVIVMINAKLGFEMEIFELFNICQTHGFPRIVGVLTHMDRFKSIHTARCVKKSIKQRFWTEIYDGAKVYCYERSLSGLYIKASIGKLARFLNTVTLRPMPWKLTHSHLLADRIEPSESNVKKQVDTGLLNIAVYGYVRGTNMVDKSPIHIPGCGDFIIEDVRLLSDPCAPPSVRKCRTLMEKERKVYAPMSGFAGVSFDGDDAVYVQKSEHEKLIEKLHVKIQQPDLTNFEQHNVSIFHSNDVDNIVDVIENVDSECCQESDSESGKFSNETYVKEIESDSDHSSFNTDKYSDIFSEGNESKDNSTNLIQCDDTILNFEDLIYKRVESIQKEKCSIFVKKVQDFSSTEIQNTYNQKFENVYSQHKEEMLGKMFICGEWDSDEDAEKLLEKDDLVKEDLEFENSPCSDVVESSGSDKDDNSSPEDENQKKIKKKKQFNATYDRNAAISKGATDEVYDEWKRKIEKKSERDKQEFDVNADIYEGYKIGSYVKVIIKRVPVELMTNFDPTYPLIVGGLLSSETTCSYVQIRLKKHRWFGKILKNRDPLVLSIGWRRVQTIPFFAVTDDNGRHRSLKYTPQYMHCMQFCWTNCVNKEMGVVALQSVSEESKTKRFRIAATGVVLGSSQSPNVVKKLKLTGFPSKIFKKTAFIKGMFNTDIEASKFEGSMIKSVSGIRGCVKKLISNSNGTFRATFEDKLVMSDIVFIRTWIRINMLKWNVVVPNLLLNKINRLDWSGMRQVNQIKTDLGIKNLENVDSLYLPVNRKEKKFLKLQIPTSLQKQLPYASRPKKMVADISENVNIKFNQETKKVDRLVGMMRMLQSNHQRTVKQKKKLQFTKSNKETEIQKKQELFEMRQKEKRKQYFKSMGKKCK